MKKFFIILIAAMLNVFGVMAEEPPSAPELSLKSGVYSDALSLTISGEGKIYYTLNGDNPTSKSTLYTGPITLSEVKEFPRFVQGVRAGEETPKGIVVRAASADAMGNMGPTVTGVYFIGADVKDFYKLPMINLTVDTYDLWDEREGIYSNYFYEHNVPAVFQYITADGGLAAERGVEIKVSGHGSRDSAKKSMRVYFTKGDISDGKYLECDIIPGTRMNFKNPAPVTKFAKLTMRISDWTNTNLRDVLAQRIASYTRADTANSVPAALFLNGEFWGVYECREQYDERYVQYHYGIDNDNIVFLDRDWTLPAQHSVLPDTGTSYTDKMEYSAGPSDNDKDGRLGESYYREQWLYVRSLAEEKDISKDEVYAEFCANVDVDNYIDFIITYIYCANDDWPGNNFKLWRVTEENIDDNVYGADGKWRFMVHDFDIAFEDARHNTLWLSSMEKLPETEARHPEFATAMLKGLLRNKDFRSEFAQRTMAYLSTAMSEKNINALVDKLTEERSVGKERDLVRWNIGRGSAQEKMDGWLFRMNGYRFFAKERPAILKEQYIQLLNGSEYEAGIKGEANFTFYCNGGGISINGAEISPERYAEAAENFQTVQFAGIPVKITAFDADGRVGTLKITHNGISETYYGTAEFTPQPSDYVVTADFTETVDAPTGSPAGIMRADRFCEMKVGEKLPAAVFASDGSRCAGSVIIIGSCVAQNGGIITAVKEGSALIRFVSGGKIFEAKVLVTK